MENRHKFKITIENVRKWLGLVVVAALAVMEAVICAQYASSDPDAQEWWMYIMLVVCCILLDVSAALKFYVIKPLNLKLAAYGADFFFLLVISVITANDFTVVLYCLVTTELYTNNNESLKLSFIIFGICAGVFVLSFILGGIRMYRGVPV